MSLPSIVVVGRLAERYKGHDVLLRALDLVGDQVPEAELHVVGAGPLRPELERSRRLGVDSRQRSTARSPTRVGMRSSRGDGVRDAEPRRARGAGEGFGIVYTEAGAHGLAVVAGNAGGALDAWWIGKRGCSLSDRSSGSRGSADGLLRDATAREMGRAGWERARTLSWDQAAERSRRFSTRRFAGEGAVRQPHALVSGAERSLLEVMASLRGDAEVLLVSPRETSRIAPRLPP